MFLRSEDIIAPHLQQRDLGFEFERVVHNYLIEDVLVVK